MHLSALFLLVKSVKVIIVAYLGFSRDFHLFLFNISLLTVVQNIQKSTIAKILIMVNQTMCVYVNFLFSLN